MENLTTNELNVVLALVIENQDSAKLQKITGMDYMQSIDLKNKINDMISISQQEEKDKDLKDKYNVSFEYGDIGQLVVQDVEADKTYKMNIDLLHNGDIAEYNIVDRDNEISCLESMISECKSDSDRELMREDLQTLQSSTEEYVIANYSTNGFLTKEDDVQAFNKACQELIESYQEFTEQDRNDIK